MLARNFSFLLNVQKIHTVKLSAKIGILHDRWPGEAVVNKNWITRTKEHHTGLDVKQRSSL